MVLSVVLKDMEFIVIRLILMAGKIYRHKISFV